MTPELKPTPLLLAVLVLLWEAPMHPYQMQRLIRERGKDFVVNVKAGSIYHAVDRLVKGGLAEVVDTSREGKRPERTTYRITDKGTAACGDWVNAMVGQPKKEYPEFAAAIAALPVLMPDGARAALERRATAIADEVTGYEEQLSAMAAYLPRVVLLEEEYILAVRRAELDWIRSVVADLQAGSLTWDFEEMRKLIDNPPPEIAAALPSREADESS